MRSFDADELLSILRLLPDPLVKIDSDWNVLYANPAAGQLLGAGSARLPEDVERALRALDSLPASEVIQCRGQRLNVEILPAEDGCRVLQFRRVSDFSEEQVETRREFIEAVLDSIESGIVACDETGTLRLFNRATRDFHGIPAEPIPPAQWASYYNLYYPDGVTPLRKEDIPLYRAFSGEIVSKAEIVIAPRNGPPRTVLSTGRPLIGKDGRKLGAVVAMHDVTHRKISNKRARQALRQFRALFDDAPIAYHEVDREGIVRRVNRAGCKLMQRTRDQILGLPVWDFVRPEDRAATQAATMRKLDGIQPLECVEQDFITPDGDTLAVELHENLILDDAGEITGIRTAVLDVTERRLQQDQARELIREQAAREQAEAASAEITNILGRIGDAYMAFDKEWRYLYVNQKAAELALKPASELVGRCVWDEFPESIHTPFYTELQRAMREQISVAFENYYAPLGKWFENSVYPSPSGVSVYYRDITERKRTQQSLEKRTIELAQTNAELEAFAYMASHDLQEPLRIVGNYTSLLARSYANFLDEDGQEYIRFTLDGVERMQRLIQDLLTLAQMRTSDPAEVRCVDATSALETAQANLAGIIQESGAIVEHQPLPAVMIVESHLTQVFQNLIANAVKYRGRQAPRIIVSAERESAQWKFSVSDNGIGFDMRFADRIFQPFKRLSKGKGGGTGIGLAICKKIVESRGGAIWADSAVELGSTFYFTIPDVIPDSDAAT